MKNVEIKAKIKNLKTLLQFGKILAGREATIIKQHDTFYNAKKGRIKLRRLDAGQAELIFYDRPDVMGPKLCLFEKVNVHPEQLSSMEQLLDTTLGSLIEVKKMRHLFIIGQTRLHIDEVENLGDFMELEVCLEPGQTPEDGDYIAKELMDKLGIQEEDLINCAYADLLMKK
ncbi:hypothetical protein ABEB36_006014 [Hypothenemus hampei]|uniref:CYTH domain-containing protein n=1 Tax=Hypothenemus hampei TaxID=57062 RepID=A0ABD1F0L9_HYPHA